MNFNRKCTQYAQIYLNKKTGTNKNFKNTNFMIFIHLQHESNQLLINTERIGRVRKFKYLGPYISDNIDRGAGVKSRVEITWSNFCLHVL